MKIVIVGGSSEVDYLIASFLNKNHHLVVINEDRKYCDYLSSEHNIPVTCGDPCRQFVLEEAQIYGYDMLIALKNDDADNFAICQYAKKLYNIKKSICTVSNPKNVDVFKKLGIDTVISATYIVANMIEQAYQSKA